MSQRNLVWILALLLLGLLFWHMPDTSYRQRSFYKVFSPLVDIRAQIHKSYVEDVDDTELLEGAIQGMLQGLDSFSRYIPPDEMDAFNQMTSGMVPGVGIWLAMQNDALTVISPVEDSPAFRAGIMPGDQILSIDGELTKNMTLFQAAHKLRGKPGTSVTLEVRHELTDVTERLTLQRAEVRIPSIKGYARLPDGSWDFMIDRRNAIAYVRITNFTDETAGELHDVLMRLQSEHAQALVMDLRFNPGGLLQSAVAVVDMFIDSGPIVSTKGKWAKTVTLSASSENTYPPIPMAILVNRYSASASEIVAGALKDHDRAVVIGDRTFGKGSVQSIFDLPDDKGAIKLTTAYYYLPKGRNIHRRRGSDEWGVDPDIQIVLDRDELIAVQQSRGQSDVLFRPQDQEKPTTTGKSTALIIDRQLARALQELRTKLTKGTSAPTTQQAVRNAG